MMLSEQLEVHKTCVTQSCALTQVLYKVCLQIFITADPKQKGFPVLLAG